MVCLHSTASPSNVSFRAHRDPGATSTWTAGKRGDGLPDRAIFRSGDQRQVTSSEGIALVRGCVPTPGSTGVEGCATVRRRRWHRRSRSLPGRDNAWHRTESGICQRIDVSPVEANERELSRRREAVSGGQRGLFTITVVASGVVAFHNTLLLDDFLYRVNCRIWLAAASGLHHHGNMLESSSIPAVP